MCVLFINPPVEDFFFTPQRAYPLGILSLATVLDKSGFKVNILNCLEEYTKKTLPVPKEFSYLKRYYQPNLSPFCLFSHYYRFGINETEICEKIKTFRPDIVGISSNFTAYFNSSLAMARLVKSIDKRITVVFGGRLPTIWPDLALSNPYIDFSLRGEAEFTFLELCQALKKGEIKNISGLCYKKFDKKLFISRHIPLIPDLNMLPVANRRLIAYKKYKFQGFFSTALLTSRGCARGCAFCAILEPFRYRKAENVIKEIEDCFSLGIRHFNFEDDNINLNPEFEKIIDKIIEKFNNKIKISFMNGLLSLGISRRLGEKLIRVGLTHLDLSIASSNRRIRAKLGRSELPLNVSRLAAFMARRKVKTTVHFIVGLPDQAFKDILRDIRFLSARPLMLGPSIFYPVIESRLFAELKRKFLIKKESYQFFRSSVAFFDKAISRDRIFLIFYVSRVINFIKGLLDDKGVKNNDIAGLLQKKLNDFHLENNIIEAKTRFDRITLGEIVLRELLERGKLYRVRQLKVNKSFRYIFDEEKYILAADIKRILHGLKIKGIKDQSVRLCLRKD